MVFMTARLVRLAALLAGVALAGSAAGCAGTGMASGGAQAGRPSVLAAFYPLVFVAEQIGGPEVRVTNLTTPGVEPHDLELTPRQVGAIADADLVIYLKGFQPAVDEAVEQNAGRALEVAGVVPLTSTPGSGTDRDPHFWLDPSKLAQLIDPVSEQLAAVDPGHAHTFAERATTLHTELAELDADYRSGLASCARIEIVTAHAAFGYLAERYRLEQIPIAGVSPDQEPAPDRIRQIQQLVQERGITTIFFERLLSADLAETIAGDTGATAALLDPLEGITDPATNDYLTVMRANLAALRKALSCT
jgi:zinc transport system substrate-binding protein